MLVYKKYHDNFFEAKLEVEEQQDGLRLDQIVGEYLSGHSREQIKKKIKAGEVKVINRNCSNKSSAKLKTKDLIEIIIHRTSHEDEYWRGELLPLENQKLFLKMMIFSLSTSHRSCPHTQPESICLIAPPSTLRTSWNLKQFILCIV